MGSPGSRNQQPSRTTESPGYAGHRSAWSSFCKPSDVANSGDTGSGQECVVSCRRSALRLSQAANDQDMEFAQRLSLGPFRSVQCLAASDMQHSLASKPGTTPSLRQCASIAGQYGRGGAGPYPRQKGARQAHFGLLLESRVQYETVHWLVPPAPALSCMDQLFGSSDGSLVGLALWSRTMCRQNYDGGGGSGGGGCGDGVPCRSVVGPCPAGIPAVL